MSAVKALVERDAAIHKEVHLPWLLGSLVGERSYIGGHVFLGVLITRALLCGFQIRAVDFWKLPERGSVKSLLRV